VLITPSFFGVEHFLKPQPGVFEVKSSIEVNARPEKVWQQIVSFAEIPPPQETIFRAGIAYPIRAEFPAAAQALCGIVFFPRGLSWNRLQSGRAAFVTLQP